MHSGNLGVAQRVSTNYAINRCLERAGNPRPKSIWFGFFRGGSRWDEIALEMFQNFFCRRRTGIRSISETCSAHRDPHRSNSKTISKQTHCFVSFQPFPTIVNYNTSSYVWLHAQSHSALRKTIAPIPVCGAIASRAAESSGWLTARALSAATLSTGNPPHTL